MLTASPRFNATVAGPAADPAPDDAEPPDATGTLVRLTTGPHSRVPPVLLCLLEILNDPDPPDRRTLDRKLRESGIDHYNAPAKRLLLLESGVIAPTPEGRDRLTPLGRTCLARLTMQDALEKARILSTPHYCPRAHAAPAPRSG